MKITTTPLNDLLLIKPKQFLDERGYFFECFQQQRYQKIKLPNFVQDNISHSKKNVLRGLHYQLPFAQGKLIWVLKGKIWDVVVDIRLQSSTFGQWFSIELDDLTHTQLYIPPGFAHGFYVLSDDADIYYKCTEYYSPSHECGIIWNDPHLAITWPTTTPILSPKDSLLPALDEIAHDKLFA